MESFKYSVIASLLRSIGFGEEQKETHVLFHHEKSGTEFLLPLGCFRNDSVGDMDIASIRRHLHDRGLMDQEEFDRKTARSASVSASD